MGLALLVSGNWNNTSIAGAGCRNWNNYRTNANNTVSFRASDYDSRQPDSPHMGRLET